MATKGTRRKRQQQPDQNRAEFQTLEPYSREAHAVINRLAMTVVRDATGEQLSALIELLTHIIRNNSSDFAFTARLAAMRSSDELLDSAADLVAVKSQQEREGGDE